MVLGQRGLGGSTFIAERFFRPREAQPVSLDGGFLPDPDGILGKTLAGDVRRRAEIHQTECCVLLGEPGMGKSITMAQRRAELPRDSFFDLRTWSAAEVLQAVRSSCLPGASAPAHIVIDSVDEADMPNFAARLVGELERLPNRGLRLELACRASEWPETLEAGLPEIFGNSAVSYFQIEPLRRIDAAAMVEAVGIDPNAFLNAIYERDLGPLAGVPLTLELLMQVFLKDGHFPHRSTEIYEKALLQLCTESSPTRRDRGRDRLSPTRSLEIAGHLAAATVLGNRSRLIERSILREGDGELAIERVLPAIDGADESAVSEVLTTGLFVHRGTDTSAFYHHSFAEFLTARWLHSSGFSHQQLRQFLFHHEAPEHLVPQMSGVATWLACMDADMAMLLAQSAPENFIEADSPVATDAHRRAAVDALMRRAHARSLTRYWWNEAESKRLTHPGLAEQLRPYVVGSKFEPFVRRKAIDIARANELTEFLDEFAAIALDDSASEAVRVEAIEAAFRCTREPATLAQRIRLLAEPDRNPEVGDDLRAAVLEQLWPRHIDSAELFRLLTRARRAHIRGSYSGFIRRVANKIGPAELVTALTWAGLAVRGHGDHDWQDFEDLAAAIFLKAWPQLDDEACREAFARAAWRTLRVYRSVLGGPGDRSDAEQLLTDTRRRHLLLCELARQCEEPGDASFIAHPYGQLPFATPADIEWVLEQRREASEPQKIFWETLVCQLLVWPFDTRIIELILGEIGEVTRTAMLPFPLFIETGSPEAVQAAACQSQEQTWATQIARREQETHGRRTREVGPWLEKAKQGDPEGWWQAVVRMRQHRERSADRELLAAFAEETDTPEDRATYLRLAKWYLEQAPTDPVTWLSEKGTSWRPSVAGYLSLRLVLQNDTAWWTEHKLTLITRWAAAILDFRVYALNEQADLDSHRVLVHEVFRASPDEGRRVVALLLEREAAAEPDLGFLKFVPAETPIGDLLERSLLATSNHVEGFQTIFEALARFDLPRAISFARCLLEPRNCSLRPLLPALVSISCSLSKRDSHRQRHAISRFYSAHQFVAVLALLGVETPEAWQLVRRACRRYPQLGRAVVAIFADSRHSNWGKHIPDTDLAELYGWLPELAATEDDSELIVPLRWFRQSLLSQLAARGSMAAVTALSSLEDVAPHDGAVQRAAAEGRQRYRERSWQPIRPEALFEMRRSATRRIVQSSEHLLEVVLEAIDGFAELVRGKSRTVEDLWSWTQAARLEDVEYSPKDEGTLSNHLKRHLLSTLTGVVVNREVEIAHTSVEHGTGENVDLLVQAVCTETHRRWSVIIEVKGSWNPELQTHLDKQLRERYLGSGEFKCGIYLVGWYDCSQWAKKDKRRAATRRLDREQVKKFLLERASVASSGGRSVRLRVLDLSIGRPAVPKPQTGRRTAQRSTPRRRP